MVNYKKHCMFKGNRLEDGREVFGSLAIEVSANPIIEPVELWHIIQLGSWAGKPMTSDDLVRPESVCMYLGRDDENGRGIYVPLKEVADSAAALATLTEKVEELRKENRHLQDLARSQRNGMEQLREELEQVKLEHENLRNQHCVLCRSARKIALQGGQYISTGNGCRCADCEWRGPQKEK